MRYEYFEGVSNDMKKEKGDLLIQIKDLQGELNYKTNELRQRDSEMNKSNSKYSTRHGDKEGIFATYGKEVDFEDELQRYSMQKKLDDEKILELNDKLLKEKMDQDQLRKEIASLRDKCQDLMEKHDADVERIEKLNYILGDSPNT